jgi:phage-related tail fiber protein
MSIEVIEIEEQSDGTARMIVDIDPTTVGILIESAIVTALKQYVDEHQEQYQPVQLELDLT